MEKKELDNEELKAVDGGSNPESYFSCCYCRAPLHETGLESRTVGSGCDEEIQYQCPHCKNWMTLGVIAHPVD